MKDYKGKRNYGAKGALDADEAEIQARLAGSDNVGDLDSMLARYAVKNHKTPSELSEKEQLEWLEKVRRAL